MNLAMENDSRKKMVLSATALIASRGLSGTSFSDVVDHSGAPRGSIYHHFPEGKKQLAESAIKLTGDHVLARQRASDPRTPADVLNSFIDLWRQVVIASSGASGCAVAGVAVDTAPGDELIGLVRETFRAWVDLLVEQLVKTGLATDRARPVALATVGGMEGALILCRAEASVEPLEIMAQELLRLLPG